MRSLFVSALLALSLAFTSCASAGKIVLISQQANHAAIVTSEQLHSTNVLNDEEFKAANVIFFQIATAQEVLVHLINTHKAAPSDYLAFALAVEKGVLDLKSASYGGKLGAVLDKLSDLDKKTREAAAKL